ncbi:MAG: hypothetical protein JSS08_08295 [Proteobacteria bacterium]|nr:hypothetical protein [Pseudomonadota bacterium]
MSTTPWTRIKGAQRELVKTGSAPVAVAVVAKARDPVGTVLLVHGRNGAPDQPHIAEIARVYLSLGWRVAAPELPHSAATPGSGPADQLTLASQRDAARQVLEWIRSAWPETSVALAGHSLGGFTVGTLSAGDAGLRHVLAVSPVLSGQRLLDARRALGPEALAELEREAPLYRKDLETADIADCLSTTPAPVAVVTGREDGLVTIDHARAYFQAARNGAFFAALPGQHHCPAGPACAVMLAAALAAVGA